MFAGRVNIGGIGTGRRAGALRSLGRCAGALRAAAGGALLAEAERLPLWLPAALGTGIAIYFALPFEPPLWIGAIAAAPLAVLLFALRAKPAPFWLAACLLAGAVGFTAAQLRTAALESPRLAREIGPTAIMGQVLEVDAVDHGYRIILGSLSAVGLPAAETPERARIRLTRRDRPPLPGDRIAVRGVLTPLPGPTMPGAFDFQRHAFFQRIGALGYAIGPAVRQADADAPTPWAVRIEAVRQSIDGRLRAGFGEGEESGVRASVAAALITGKRADIPEDVLNAMRDSGLAHLLAISGLNFALAAGLVFCLLRAGLALAPPIALRFPIKKWAAAVSCAVAFGYLLLSGGTVPTQRAFLMLGAALLAILVDRMQVSMRPVALAAAAILILRPEALLGASFQLSFAAVIALVAAYEAVRERRSADRAPREAGPLTAPLLYFAAVSFTTVVATLATAPFGIYHFNRFATYSLAANLVAVPVTAFWVMPAGVFALLAMPFGLERLPLAAMGAGIDVIVMAAQAVAAWPGAVVRFPAMPTGGLVLVALGGLWLTLWCGRWRLFGLIGIGAGLATLTAVHPPDILVAGDGRLIAVRGTEGALLASTLRADRFVREAWERRTDAARVEAWPTTGGAENGMLRCDRIGCLYSANGHRVALPAEGEALEEDCRLATAIVSRIPVRASLRAGPCARVPTLIDRNDLRRDGGHALWLGADGRIRMETVRAAQGDRPWIVPPQPARRPRAPAAQ